MELFTCELVGFLTIVVTQDTPCRLIHVQLRCYACDYCHGHLLHDLSQHWHAWITVEPLYDEIRGRHLSAYNYSNSFYMYTAVGFYGYDFVVLLCEKFHYSGIIC